MTTIYDCGDSASLLTGMRMARQAIARGELVIMPTDTVYGVAADAFDHEAVSRLLAAKGRDRTSPPPVLIGDVQTLDALAISVPEAARRLVERHWPGPLTIIVHARPSLTWDLGETHGTVALRIPESPIALELLAETGPLAVSSANAHGVQAPTTAQPAADMLGHAVDVVLDAGETGQGSDVPEGAQNGSTIVDATTDVLRIVRQGVLSRAAIAEIAGDALAEPA